MTNLLRCNEDQMQVREKLLYKLERPLQFKKETRRQNPNIQASKREPRAGMIVFMRTGCTEGKQGWGLRPLQQSWMENI